MTALGALSLNISRYREARKYAGMPKRLGDTSGLFDSGPTRIDDFLGDARVWLLWATTRVAMAFGFRDPGAAARQHLRVPEPRIAIRNLRRGSSAMRDR